MASKRILKLIITILIVLFTVSMFSSCVYGADNFSLTGFKGTADASIKKPVTTIMGAIIAVLRIVFTGIAILMMAALGMKYMMAAPGDRADVKKSLVQYVVGAVIFFGAAGILTLLNNAINGIVGE